MRLQTEVICDCGLNLSSDGCGCDFSRDLCIMLCWQCLSVYSRTKKFQCACLIRSTGSRIRKLHHEIYFINTMEIRDNLLSLFVLSLALICGTLFKLTYVCLYLFMHHFVLTMYKHLFVAEINLFITLLCPYL